MLEAEARDRVIVALDCGREEALALGEELKGRAQWVKIGMTLFYAEGPSIVTAFKERGFKVFLERHPASGPRRRTGRGAHGC